MEWLGDVPAHWEVRRLKGWLGVNERVLSEETDPGCQFDYLDIGSVETGRLAEEPTRIRFEDSPSRARRVVRCGDTIISTVRTYLKAVWHARDAGTHLVASTGFAVLTPRGDAIPGFVSFCCQSDSFTDRITAESVGIAYPAIAESKLARLKVCVPPTSEQAAITRFLDHATSHIDRYIRAKEKLIALLEEQKQAIINEAVTGRIDVRTGDPYATYKKSGIEGLGNVPAHWQIRELGRMGRFFKGNGGTKADEINEGSPCVRYGDLYTFHRFHVRKTRSFVDPIVATTTYTPIEYGDVLFAGSGETIDEIGKSAVNLMCSGCCGGDVIVFRPNIEMDAAFLGYATDCPYAARQKARMGRGFTVIHIYSTDLKYMTIAVPPLSDQLAIASFLGQAVKDMDGAIYRTQSQIELAVEYRARLIADIVTGKLDVRRAVAELLEVEAPASEYGAFADGIQSNSHGTNRGIAEGLDP